MQYSIVNLSEVKANDWRLDAEYWRQENLLYKEKLQKIGFSELGNISKRL
jgi:hypothetical protein